jgi:hypothetical protein
MSVEQDTVPGIRKQVNTFYLSLLVRYWYVHYWYVTGTSTTGTFNSPLRATGLLLKKSCLLSLLLTLVSRTFNVRRSSTQQHHDFPQRRSGSAPGLPGFNAGYSNKSIAESPSTEG